MMTSRNIFYRFFYGKIQTKSTNGFCMKQRDCQNAIFNFKSYFMGFKLTEKCCLNKLPWPILELVYPIFMVLLLGAGSITGLITASIDAVFK